VPLVHRRPLVALAALGAAALVAGCGGGDSTLSADEFRERADAVCADAGERLDALTEPTAGEEVLPYLETGLPIQAEELERIRELEPPDELQAAFDEALELNQQRQDLIRQAADRIEGGEDPQAVIAEVGPELERLQAEARAKARELGLAVCGADDDASGATTAPQATDTAPATSGAAPAGQGNNEQYVADVQAAADALRSFGSILQGTTSLDDLRARVPEARAQLDEFDAAIAKLDSYRLDNATLEEQRAGLSETGPRVTQVLRRFVAAAESGDPEAVQGLVPEVTQAISDFQDAATP
jgi:hypothetical protein